VEAVQRAQPPTVEVGGANPARQSGTHSAARGPGAVRYGLPFVAGLCQAQHNVFGDNKQVVWGCLYKCVHLHAIDLCIQIYA
jgi:hypothetical protein